MALPRRLVKAIRAGDYIPSPASKKAREAATRLRNQRIDYVAPGPPPGPAGGPPRDTFRSVKERMASKKHGAFYGTAGYNPTESARAVFGSDEFRAMQGALGYTSEQLRGLASLAGKAHALEIRTGDAGELEVYLKYDFLFYH
jgi:hypothetical protein